MGRNELNTTECVYKKLKRKKDKCLMICLFINAFRLLFLSEYQNILSKLFLYGKRS